jgi:hypothetical protein
MQLNKEVTLPAISGAGSTELNVRGGCVPPVSPEVIKILLFQRSCRLMDAPLEHVMYRAFRDECKIQ